MYEPLLARLPQDRVTQRMCAAWFSRFQLETLLRLREESPEVFDMIIGHIVRVHVQERRRFMLVVHAVALYMCADAAVNLYFRNWWAMPFVLAGFAFVARTIRRMSPERCAPRFVVRFDGAEVRADLLS